MRDVQITEADSAGAIIGNSFRPSIPKLKAGEKPDTPRPAYLRAEDGQIIGNSVFDSREWTLFDSRVSASARMAMRGIQDLRSAGLVVPVSSIGIRQIDRRIQGEKRAANITMETASRVDSDRTERKMLSVPLPVIHQDYQIGERELAASRMMGMPLDTLEAAESGQSVGETLESMLFNGSTAVTFNGNAIKGYNNATGLLSDTASNFGGGDFGTADNAYKTVLGVLASFETRRYRGKFNIYISTVQYHQLLGLRGDTNNTTQMQLLMALPQINDIVLVDTSLVADGYMLVVALQPDVVELYEALPVTNREWMSGNRTVFYGKVLTVAVPFVKYDVRGYTGIAKVSGI